ncbi:unnamed protein product, partial [Phaeothamnion confervicola]
PSQLTLSLASSHHSLWGHRLWNASLRLAELIDEHEIDVRGRTVLELGAGAGLPGLMCALNGARHVVVSDYATPRDTVLVDVIEANIDRLRDHLPPSAVAAIGYIWGQPVAPLLAAIGDEAATAAAGACVDSGNVRCRSSGKEGGGFDLILMADLIFNRSEHERLLRTCDDCLAPDGTAWVAFSHHDPSKAAHDMRFFELATAPGTGAFEATLDHQVQMTDIFVENDGLDGARGVVYVYRLVRR